MRTYASDVRRRRTLARIIEDSIGIFRQDASEYAFAGLIGAFAACIATLVLVAVGGPVATALLPLVLVPVAVATLATVTEALRRVTDHLEPSAAESFTVVLRGLPAIVWPWLPLAGGLALALFADAEFGGDAPSVVRGVAELSLVVVTLWVASVRVLSVPSLVMRRATPEQAVAEARRIFAASRATCAGVWAACLAPALLLFLVAALNGFGAVSSAIAALAFVGSLPFAAVMNSLLFFDAVAVDESAAPRSEASQATVTRRTTGLRRLR
ncbi:MAG: hypothetical protein IVW36_09365 [Dehalococcoidia bacterium]|nr:hypothetical protein [Dehalococcoidia bacterium]